MAIVANTTPGAVLTGRFSPQAGPQDPEVQAFVQRVDALLRGGQLSAFAATRRQEGGHVIVEVFPAESAPAGAQRLGASDAWAGAASAPLADGDEAFAWGDGDASIPT